MRHSITLEVILKPFLAEPLTVMLYALESSKLSFFLTDYIYTQFFTMAQQPPVGQGLPIIENS
jgi:hypothetical protein